MISKEIEKNLELNGLDLVAKSSSIKNDVNNNNNSNINNNIQNNLNDNDTVDVDSNLIEIRDLVSELDNEQNIMNRDAFIQSGKFKMVVDKFNMAFI